jgi:hypothetical protein
MPLFLQPVAEVLSPPLLPFLQRYQLFLHNSHHMFEEKNVGLE